jgi:hypothetical protein
MSIVMIRRMWKKLNEALWKNVRNGQSIFESNLSKVDDNIITVFHRNDALEITKKTKLDTEIVQLP